MTIPANTGAENNWGSQPVTPVWGSQGGPYNVTGAGTNALPVQGPTAAGNAAVANPQLAGGVDGGGNVQANQTNQTLTLLASAARTASTASAAQNNQNGKGLTLVLNISAASGTGGLTVQFQVQDPVSGTWKTIAAATTAQTATGTYMYHFYPAATGSGNNFTQLWSIGVPQTWRVNVSAGDSSSYTYSLAAYTHL
jgi:hypothetical protein